MKGSSVVVLVAAALAVSGCRTIQDIQYVQASNAAEEGRDEDAFRKYLAVAQADGYDGQASAQFLVADMYLEGRGTPKNPAEAVRLFELVARSNDRTWRRHALYRLGDLHERGVPGVVEKDRAKAAQWFKSGAAEGDRISAKRLETLSSYPEVYVEMNPAEFQPQGPAIAPAGMAAAAKAFENGKKAEAFQTFLWHARRGNEEAQTIVAKLYKDGSVVDRDPKKYAAWAWLAARNGSARAQFEMGLLNNSDDVFLGNDREAEYWFKLASDQGLAEATNWLGIIAAHPLEKNAKPDWAKAVGYFRKAAEGGSTFALLNLGDAYRDGMGVPADQGKATEYYRQAAAAGNVEARKRLAEAGLSVPTAQGSKPEPRQRTPEAAPQVTVAPKVPSKPSSVEIYSSASPSVFQLLAIHSSGPRDASQGSAVAVTQKVAITNCHVLEGKDTFGAKFAKDVNLFTLVRKNPKKDICVVQSDMPMRAVGQIRRYSELKVGEKVYAIGSPQALENTLSEGIVSGLREMDGVKYVQTTAPIAQGSSGGALFDEEGRLIGITTFMVKGAGSLNFAVAIDEAIEELDKGRLWDRR